MAEKYGLPHLAFFTVTFPDWVTPKEASKRFNVLNTGVLQERYQAWVAVYERGGKTQRLHFHLVVACAQDVRSGADFEAFSRGDYSSANAALRQEWAFWREATNYNGRRWSQARYGEIGRTEFLPIKSTADGIRKYVGKYIEKHMGNRHPEDKGVRLVRMSQGLSTMTVRFAWHSPRACLWRMKVAQFAQENGCGDLDQVREKFGPRWAYKLRDSIRNVELPGEVVAIERTFPTQDGPQAVRLADIERSDRMDVATALAPSLGLTAEETYAALFQPQFRAQMESSFNVKSSRGPGGWGEVSPSAPGTACRPGGSPGWGDPLAGVSVESISEGLRAGRTWKPTPSTAIVPGGANIGP